MKTILSTALCFVLCCLCWLSCKKGEGEDGPLVNAFHCESPGVIYMQSGDGKLALPDAFTPNGDGRNDVFRPVFTGIDSNDYHLSIALSADKLVYESTRISTGWNGKMPDGTPCAPGRYAVILRFRAANGVVTDTCNYINLLEMKANGSCILTHGFVYHFADQVDADNPDRGFVRSTQEILCP